MKMSDLALFGGDPIRKTPFYSWPRVVDGQQEKLIDTLVNDSWGIGSESIKELEEKFAVFHEAKSCIAINTGTNALWVALKAAGISSGDSSPSNLLVDEFVISSGLRGNGPVSSTFGDVCVICMGSFNIARGWLASLNPALMIGSGSFLADSDSCSA